MTLTVELVEKLTIYNMANENTEGLCASLPSIVKDWKKYPVYALQSCVVYITLTQLLHELPAKAKRGSLLNSIP